MRWRTRSATHCGDLTGTASSLAKAKRGEGLELQDVPEPSIGPNDVLIRTRNTSICGTDIHIYNWDEWSQKTIPVPMTIGHEFAGVVEQVGSEVAGLKEGDRVSGEGQLGSATQRPVSRRRSSAGRCASRMKAR